MCCPRHSLSDTEVVQLPISEKLEAYMCYLGDGGLQFSASPDAGPVGRVEYEDGRGLEALAASIHE